MGLLDDQMKQQAATAERWKAWERWLLRYDPTFESPTHRSHEGRGWLAALHPSRDVLDEGKQEILEDFIRRLPAGAGAGAFGVTCPDGFMVLVSPAAFTVQQEAKKARVLADLRAGAKRLQSFHLEIRLGYESTASWGVAVSADGEAFIVESINAEYRDYVPSGNWIQKQHDDEVFARAAAECLQSIVVQAPSASSTSREWSAASLPKKKWWQWP